jgi:hypothetical protein
MVANAPSDLEVNWLDVDRLERRYRLVYLPAHIFLENARQVVDVSAVGLVIGATVYALHYALSGAAGSGSCKPRPSRALPTS